MRTYYILISAIVGLYSAPGLAERAAVNDGLFEGKQASQSARLSPPDDHWQATERKAQTAQTELASHSRNGTIRLNESQKQQIRNYMQKLSPEQSPR